ncbi:unnamed protein product [Chironomus riparius]|uniref:Ionotropic receptor n=1 Tax=Chironomus riparius TaxID=315576 RepID=A0A9N9WV79_9DIPT|nr:unnamed protein product [Chironomus riparius]
MKFLWLFLCFSLTMCEIAVNYSDKIEVKAILSVCEEFFITKSINLDIILYGDVDPQLNDITNSFMRTIARNASLNVTNIAYRTSINHLITKSSIILMSHSRDQKNLYKKIEFLNNLKNKLTIILYLHRLDPHVSITLPDNFEYATVNFYYLVNMKIQLNFMAPIAFSSIRCNQIRIKTLNIFSKNETKWLTELKYPKFSNLFGCPLTFMNSYGKFLYLKSHDKLSINYGAFATEDKFKMINKLSLTGNYQGFMVDMAEILSKIIDFKPQYRFLEAFDFKTNKDPVEKISEGFMASYAIFHDTNYLTDNFVVFATNIISSNVDAYFLDPFNFHTWIAVLTSLFVAFVVIFYINLRLGIVRIRPRKELTRSALNVLEIVFGCPQNKLPRANFGRFLIILFIGLCLVLRICYWSQLVKLKATGVDKIGPETVEDLVEGNYTIYSCYQPFSKDKIQMHLFQIVDHCEDTTEFFCGTMKNSDTNVGFLILKDKIHLFNKACSNLFITSKVLKINLATTVLQLTKVSVIQEAFNYILRKLTPAGIPQYLLAHHTSALYGTDRIIKEKESGKSSFDDMKFVFVLWMFGCGISIVTLALEIFRVTKL